MNSNKSGGHPKYIPEGLEDVETWQPVIYTAGRAESQSHLDQSVCGSLTRRHSGLDLQRELVQGVFIHHERLVQQELCHLEGRETLIQLHSRSLPLLIEQLNRYPFIFTVWKLI